MLLKTAISNSNLPNNINQNVKQEPQLQPTLCKQLSILDLLPNDKIDQPDDRSEKYPFYIRVIPNLIQFVLNMNYQWSQEILKVITIFKKRGENIDNTLLLELMVALEDLKRHLPILLLQQISKQEEKSNYLNEIGKLMTIINKIPQLSIYLISIAPVLVNKDYIIALIKTCEKKRQNLSQLIQKISQHLNNDLQEFIDTQNIIYIIAPKIENLQKILKQLGLNFITIAANFSTKNQFSAQQRINLEKYITLNDSLYDVLAQVTLSKKININNDEQKIERLFTKYNNIMQDEININNEEQKNVEHMQHYDVKPTHLEIASLTLNDFLEKLYHSFTNNFTSIMNLSKLLKNINKEINK